jgi:hypothetical protein
VKTQKQYIDTLEEQLKAHEQLQLVSKSEEEVKETKETKVTKQSTRKPRQSAKSKKTDISFLNGQPTDRAHTS